MPTPDLVDHLHQQRIPFKLLRHAPAVTAQEVAQVARVPGWRLAKVVAVLVDGKPWLCAVPAPVQVDLDAVLDSTAGQDVRLCTEGELRQLCPGCRPGTLPPLGKYLGLPLLIDPRLIEGDTFFAMAGAHDELLELDVDAYLRAEDPDEAPIGALPGDAWAHAQPPAAPEPHPWH